MSDIQSIKRISDHRAVSQDKLTNRDQIKYSPRRTSPHIHHNKIQTRQFSQYPWSTSEIDPLDSDV